MIWLDSAVNVTPGSSNEWVLDVDISASAPNATIAILRLVNTDAGASRYIGYRSADSAQDIKSYVYAGCQSMAYCAVGTGGLIDLYSYDNTKQLVYLVGYFTDDAANLDTIVDYTPVSTGSYVDVDISASAPAGAIAGIFRIETGSSTTFSTYGRKNGSADDFYISVPSQIGMIVGLDANRVCEFKINSTSLKVYLTGWLLEGEVYTDVVDISLTSVGSYINIDLTSQNPPAGANGAIILVKGSTNYNFDLRENGSADAIYYAVRQIAGSFVVGMDADDIIEGKIAATAVDFYLQGFTTTGDSSASSSPSASVSASPSASGSASISASPSNPSASASASLSDSPSTSESASPSASPSASESSSPSASISGSPSASASASISGSPSSSVSSSPSSSPSASISGSPSASISGTKSASASHSASGSASTSASNSPSSSPSASESSSPSSSPSASKSSSISGSPSASRSASISGSPSSTLSHSISSSPSSSTSASSSPSKSTSNSPTTSASTSASGSVSSSPSASPSPSASASASGSTAAYTSVCYVLNLETKRTYQFSNYDFRGMGRFNEKLIAASQTVIYDLETTATHDHETDITAYMELGQLDFGLPNHKGIRGIYFECSGGTQVSVTVTKIDGTAATYTITKDQFRSLPRTMIDKAFSIKIANVSGEQLTLHRFHQKLNLFDIGGM